MKGSGRRALERFNGLCNSLARSHSPLHWTRQVAVAVLLDNFIQASARIEEEEQREAARQHKEAARVNYPLDPLLEQLSRDYTDDADLSSRLLDLFKVLPSRPLAAFVPGALLCVSRQQHLPITTDRMLGRGGAGPAGGRGRLWTRTVRRR